MYPAKSSKRLFERTRMLIVNSHAKESIVDSTVSELAKYLKPGDLLVVNESGTIPASFRGMLSRTQETLEIRLASFRGPDTSDYSRWAAISFGDGDWHLATEARGPAPLLFAGDLIQIAEGFFIEIESVNIEFPRLLEIKLHSEYLLNGIYQWGRPIQYSYLNEPLQTWDQQTIFSGPPLSVEPPSASFPLNWEQILNFQKKGIKVASLLHGAGLSSSGDLRLDQLFPLKEYYEIPNETLMLIEKTHRGGGRVIALGTSVARALESISLPITHGPQKGYTQLKLSSESNLRIVNILITGMHEAGTSHSDLMKAFCDRDLLEKAETAANRLNYRSHEFGDITLLDFSKS